MQKRIGVIAGKFIFAFFFFNYLVYFIIRQIMSIGLQDVIGLNRDLLENREQVEEAFGSNVYDNFFTYLFRGGLFGNWGVSFLSGEPVAIGNALGVTLIWLTLSMLITFAVGYLLVKLLFWEDREKLEIFDGNWLLYLMIFLLPLVLLILFPGGWWVYDGFRTPVVYQSPAYWIAILFTSAFGISKMVSELAMVPTQRVTDSGTLDFPETDTDTNNNAVLQQSEKWNPLKMTLFAFKNTTVFLVEILFFLELAMNIPGAIRQLLLSVLFADLPVIAAILFYVILFVLVIQLVIDLVFFRLDFDEANMLRDHRYNREDVTSIKFNVAKYLTYGFIGLSAITLLIWLMTGFNLPGIPFLHNPNTTNVSVRNLPPFSSGHIFGTDYLGRDVFSQLIFGTSIFLLPIIITAILRPLIIILVDNLPDFRGIHLSYEISDIMQSIPKIPFIIILSLMISLSDSLLAGPLLFILFSLLFWGWPSKYYLSTDQATSNGVSLLSKYQLLAPISISSLLGEYFLLVNLGLGFNTLLSVPNWGSMLNSMIQNYPTKYFGVLFFTYLFIVVVLMSTTVYAISSIRRS